MAVRHSDHLLSWRPRALALKTVEQLATDQASLKGGGGIGQAGEVVGRW